MKISQEQKLALKISSILLLIVFGISSIFQYLNYIGIIDFMGNRGLNKYIIFFISSIIIYFVSLKLAFLTTKPIKDMNQKLKDYNHNLAHEIKTPLSIIKTNLELLELSYEKNLITSSFEEINSMENIINSLLFLSENSINKGNEKVIFNDIITKYSQDKITIETKEDFIVKGDKNLFEICIKNIIENALKYSSDGYVGIKIGDGEVLFYNTVGPDISKENLQKYFEVFYRGKNSHKGPGYGIGLSVVKKICDTYNLNISIEIRENIFYLKIKK